MHKPACPKTLAYNMRLQQREKKIEKERRIKTIRESEREREHSEEACMYSFAGLASPTY
ncbi:unnamed protein product, partial [Musa hybrid cultivar]